MKLWRNKEEPIDAEATKARSIAEIRRLGGKAIDGLPLTDETKARTAEEVAARALVLYALMGFAYEAEVPLVRGWLEANDLTRALSPDEAARLRKPTEALTDQEISNAGWGVEAVLALLWAGGLVKDLGIERLVSMDDLASLPKVGAGESAGSFTRRVRLRPYRELFEMRDLYYRAHWYARDGGLNGYDTGEFSIDVIMKRRKALEWLLDASQAWDDVEMST